MNGQKKNINSLECTINIVFSTTSFEGMEETWFDSTPKIWYI